MSQRAKRSLTVGILGGAILLALAAGITAQQRGDAQAAPGAQAAVVPSGVPVGVGYRLSGPNELNTDTTGIVPANSAPVVYQVSAPNEANPDGTVSIGTTPATNAPVVHQLSFPNESNPDGTISSGAVSTSYPSYNLSYPNESEPVAP